MDFPNGSRDMSDAQGYNADLIRILQSALNFTSIIVPVHGFGSITSNGSWTGMVGALARRRNISHDQNPQTVLGKLLSLRYILIHVSTL
ncbi:hypothetical protein Pmani_006317 [Petrolisthes manimaculis]|uniref:Ionotropic glutamate receptor L-glutamate and glycine-binding domain-containing protein n=1 Tax=Petrolisthes manimaculis TaxID=1843537 RepID=A0AAE1QAJ1_9EUCA|nr:hypothetical protein Pmani_006317 [Petrolisthes manimaculis]